MGVIMLDYMRDFDRDVLRRLADVGCREVLLFDRGTRPSQLGGNMFSSRWSNMHGTPARRGCGSWCRRRWACRSGRPWNGSCRTPRASGTIF